MREARPEGLRVLWQDDTALVCDKPCGLLVHNAAFAGPREQTVTERVRATHGADLCPVHRLDRGTSGALLFARRERVSLWQRAFGEAGTDKRYVALARGYVRTERRVDHPLADERGVKREAQSLLRPLCSAADPGCTLVEVRVFTGRSHQVRRHLKHLSHPVIGDANYGHGALNRAFRERYGLDRLALHASRIAITHPLSGARIVVRAQVPEELLGPWREIFTDEALSAALPRPWRWPLGPSGSPAETLVRGHPGAFAAIRRHDVHTGVDLYCQEGSAVHAVEDGVVVAIEDFTGARAGSPWWLDTRAVLLEGRSGVVLYGEIDPSRGLWVGHRVREGEPVGTVTRVLAREKGLPTTMLHLELYAPGTRSALWWRLGEPSPEALRDPTDMLVEAAVHLSGCTKCSE